jgi:hypothetical protein
MSATEQAGIPRWQIITGYVLSGLPGLAFLPSAYMKIAQPAGFLDSWTKNYSAGSALPLGIIEIGSYILYWIPRTRVLGALLLTAYLGGAVATHVHMGDGNFPVPIIVAVLLWGGLWARDRRLRRLMPLTEAE